VADASGRRGSGAGGSCHSVGHGRDVAHGMGNFAVATLHVGTA
jgi:hypothetical protein